MTQLSSFYDGYWYSRNGQRDGLQLDAFVDLDATELAALQAGFDAVTATVTLVADAGADLAAQASPVTLDGTGSTDATTYLWLEAGVEIAHGDNPSVALSVATHTITLQVTDGTNVRTDMVVVEVTS